jgi:hypothetical protein
MKAVSAPLIVAAAAAGAVAAAAAGAVAAASSAQALAGRARHPTAPPIPIANNVRMVRFMVAGSALWFPVKTNTPLTFTMAALTGNVPTSARTQSILIVRKGESKSKIVDEIGTTPLDQCRISLQRECRGRTTLPREGT